MERVWDSLALAMLPQTAAESAEAIALRSGLTIIDKYDALALCTDEYFL